MKTKYSIRTFMAAMLVTVSGFSAFAATVEIEGVIDKVVPEKTEIYVLANGKKHEFYFTGKTEILKYGQAIPFATLKKSDKVKVTADKVGKRLDPLKVELLD